MIRWVFLLTAFLFMPLGINAVSAMALDTEVVPLYVIEQVVPDQSEKSRKQAAEKALLRVVAKNTGSLVSQAHPSVQSALPSAHKLLTDFEYLPYIDEETGDRSWKIRFRFQERQIVDLLREARLPSWSKRRPRVLLWLLIDTAQGQSMVYETNLLAEKAVERFSERAVPVILPIGDLEDSFALSHAELWQLSYQPVLAASQRYPGTVVLAGRVTQLSDGSWMGSWMSLFDIRPSYRDIKADKLEQFMDMGVDLVASQMSARYAIRPGLGESEPIYIQLGGVISPEDYVEMMKFWERIHAVREVQVKQISNGITLLSLRIDGELQQLQAILDLEQRLELMNNSAAMETQTADLYYQWNGRQGL